MSSFSSSVFSSSCALTPHRRVAVQGDARLERVRRVRERRRRRARRVRARRRRVRRVFARSPRERVREPEKHARAQDEAQDERHRPPPDSVLRPRGAHADPVLGNGLAFLVVFLLGRRAQQRRALRVLAVVLQDAFLPDFLRVGPAVVSLAGGVVLISVLVPASALVPVAAPALATAAPRALAAVRGVRGLRRGLGVKHPRVGIDRGLQRHAFPRVPAVSVARVPSREPRFRAAAPALIVAAQGRLLALLRRLLAALGRAESHGGAPTRVGTCDFGRGPRGAPPRPCFSHSIEISAAPSRARHPLRCASSGVSIAPRVTVATRRPMRPRVFQESSSLFLFRAVTRRKWASFFSLS